jgi:hypothetical protein
MTIFPARLTLVLTAVLLASCNSRLAQSPCTGGVCKATVVVSSCEGGQMQVSPDPIPVPAPNNIEWTIETAGFKFAQNGIVVNGSGFTNPHATGNGRKFIVHDDHSDLRPDIKYAVRLVRDSDGVACGVYDPFIKNE